MQVEGGPLYELQLVGRASIMQYALSARLVDMGKVPFDQVVQAAIVLENRGAVPFHFRILDLPGPPEAHAGGAGISGSGELVPGVPVIVPSQGFIEAHTEEMLVIKFLPGLPAIYRHLFHLQVAHFEPETLEFRVEAEFPRLLLDLPRLVRETAPAALPNDPYVSLMREACLNLEREWFDDVEPVLPPLAKPVIVQAIPTKQQQQQQPSEIGASEEQMPTATAGVPLSPSHSSLNQIPAAATEAVAQQSGGSGTDNESSLLLGGLVQQQTSSGSSLLSSGTGGAGAVAPPPPALTSPKPVSEAELEELKKNMSELNTLRGVKTNTELMLVSNTEFSYNLS